MVGWMWGALLGTLVFAPVFGAVVGLAAALKGGPLSLSILDGVIGGIAGGLLSSCLVAVVAMVIGPLVAVLMTRADTDVDSPRYSRRVRLAVASTLATVALPFGALLAESANHVLIQVAFSLLPLFVFIAAMSFGRISVAYTREIFDPVTAYDPSVLRRVGRDRAETRFRAMQPRLIEMLDTGVSEREVAAFLTYKARMDFAESQRRVALIRQQIDRPVGELPPTSS